MEITLRQVRGLAINRKIKTWAVLVDGTEVGVVEYQPALRQYVGRGLYATRNIGQWGSRDEAARAVAKSA